MTTRRSFLLGAAALLATPAVVRPGILMPVKKIVAPLPVPKWCPPGWLPCDGRVLSATDYPELVNLFGNTLPDLSSDLAVVDIILPHKHTRPLNLAYKTIICADPEKHPVGILANIAVRE